MTKLAIFICLMSCSLTRAQDKGMIISENYPDNYPNNFNRNYTINAEERVLITFSDFDLEVERVCSYDWLMIEDGDGSTLLSKMCGSDIPAPVRTNTNTAVIIFHSDWSENFRGFKITWELSPSDSTCDPCSDCNGEESKCDATSGCTFDVSNEVCLPDDKGIITSENYPANYPNNFNRNYTINAEDRILITFSDFDLEVERVCSYDWLLIVDGDGSTLLSKTCGSDIPAPVRTNTNTAVIIFHSDRSETFRGFNITWELSPSDSTCEPCSDCNGQQSKCEATSGCNLDAINDICVPDNGCYCGEAKRNQNMRIAAGTETEVNEYPWLASIGTRRRNSSGSLSNWICGGSVISDQWVLTAAHCVVKNRHGDVVRVTVELGQHQLNTAALLEVSIPLAQVIIHPDYRRPRGSSNDLALLKLVDPVDFNNVPDVRPVCLPSDRDESFTGLRATVAGWGKTAPNEGTSNVPLETEVNVISDSKCKETYGSSISDDMICTISPRDGAVYQGSCGGDSGGPLMIADDRNSSYTLIGAVSWGAEICTSQRVPGVHSRITSNMDWITETIAGTSTCPSRTGGK